MAGGRGGTARCDNLARRQRLPGARGLDHAGRLRDPARVERRYREIKSLATVQPVLRNDGELRDLGRSRLRPTATGIGRTRSGSTWRRSSNATGRTPPRARIRARRDLQPCPDRRGGCLPPRRPLWRDPDSLPAAPSKTILGSAQKHGSWTRWPRATPRPRSSRSATRCFVDYHEWGPTRCSPTSDRSSSTGSATGGSRASSSWNGDRTSPSSCATSARAVPLYELTASPIANRPFPGGLELPNPIRIGGYGGGDSYGVLDLDTTRSPGPGDVPDQGRRRERDRAPGGLPRRAPIRRLTPSSDSFSHGEGRMPLSTGDGAPGSRYPPLPERSWTSAPRSARARSCSSSSARVQLRLHGRAVRGARRLAGMEGDGRGRLRDLGRQPVRHPALPRRPRAPVSAPVGLQPRRRAGMASSTRTIWPVRGGPKVGVRHRDRRPARL